VLSGCGPLDGAEIHEAVACQLALAKRGASAFCLAPDAPQFRTFNHLTGEDAPEPRNMLVEAARIAKGRITPLEKADPAALDAVLLPGGYGAGRALSDFSYKGRDGSLRPDLERLLTAIVTAGKPLAAVCVAGGLAAILMKKLGRRATITMGSNNRFLAEVEAMGHTHVVVPASKIVVDEPNRLITSPGYLGTRSLVDVFEGIDKTVEALLIMVGQTG
jgi:enhancing lycopene biosynthesis protein 2